ncbi:MAG: response regulator [Proteobacteria bacterium]|nr:response regulator [Pseudomonadota bacterium]
MRILIVDDNLAMRKVLSALFESHGHQVVAALEDGSGLSECVRQHSPDLVCLDYNLPGRNGLELLAELNSASPEIDVVMLTGSDDPELVGQAADAGAAGFLHKPFSQPQILEELRHVEETRRIADKTVSGEHLNDLSEPEQSKRTAVIIDDSGSIRLLLKGILEGIGLKVLQTVSSGHEGIEAAKKHLPDVVTLDVDMPGMSGLMALPLIRDVSPQSKIVMVTGNTDKALVQMAVAGGAKGYILKPLRPAHVEAFMKKLLA